MEINIQFTSKYLDDTESTRLNSELAFLSIQLMYLILQEIVNVVGVGGDGFEHSMVVSM